MANNGAYIVIDGETYPISRELRFLHHSGAFPTREDATNYVDQSLADGNINSDYAQPIVVAYEDENGFSQIILGIGLGEGEGYHFIDSHALEHDVKALIASIGTGDEGADLVYDDKKLLSVKDQIATINQTIQNGDPEEIVSFDPEHTIAAKISEILNYIENATASIGLNADGTLGEFNSTEYIADGQSLKEAVETLDENLADVQKQVTSNKISSADHSIVVNQEPEGTDISVNLDGKTIVLDDEGTVLSGLWIKKYDEGDNIGSNLLAVYKLVDVDGNPIEGSRDIEIPKDRALFSAALGDMGDEFNRPYEGDVHKTLFPDDIKSGTLEEEALRFIYELADGVFQMVLINIEEFLQEAEFKDGLEVNNHEVSVKLDKTPGSDSERFLDFVEVPGENAAVGLHGITDAIQVETDRAIAQEDKIEASVGLAEDGSHIETEGHYTSGASTIAEEIAKLDAEAFRNSGETDAIEVGVGLNEDGEYIKTEDRFTSGASSITEAIKALNDHASDNQDELDNVETNIGLDDNGNYVPYEDGSYTSGATTVLEATSKLDDAVKDLQEQITANKIYGEDAIKVRREDSGTTVSVKIGDGDQLLTNDEDGLHTTIDLVEVEGEELAALGSNVKEAYKLTGVGDAQIGQYIKIYRDSVIYRIAIGDMGDKFTNFEPGSECMITTNPREENITHGTTGKEAIRIIYDMGIVNEEGKELYQMVLVDVDEFLQLNEFKDGLEVVQGETSKVVKVKIDEESEGFLTVSIDGVKLSGVQDAINVERDRAIAEEDRIETSVGLDVDGNYIQKEGTAYLDEATSVEGEIAALDAAAKANKVYGDKAIKVATEATGTTVSLEIGENDKLLTNDDEGLHTTIDLIEVDGEELAALGEDVKTAYKLTGVGDEQIGAYVKIFKDAAVYAVAIGDMGDEFKHPYEGNPMVTKFPEDENIEHGETGKEALRIIYRREDGLYEMKLINLDEFIQLDEFKDGLVVDGNVVKVKIDEESENFLTVSIDGVKLSGVQDAINVERDRALAEEDRIEAGVGLDADGNYIPKSGTAYLDGAESVEEEIAALDAEALRNSGETDAIEAGVGLDADGNYIPYENGTYTQNATTTLEATSNLDDALKDVQEQVTANKVYGEDAIKVNTVASGTTVSLKLLEDGILTNENDGLHATLAVKSLTPEEISVLSDASNVREAYKLVGIDGVSAYGDIIKIYKDSTLYSVVIGDMGDYFNDGWGGDHYLTQFPYDDNIIHGETGKEALRLIYHLENGLYRMTLIDLESFVQESEFKDGLVVKDNEVSVKLDTTPGSDSERFLDFVEITGENAAVGLHGITDAIQVETDRATAQEDVIEANVGLAADGTHITTTGHYTSSATTIAGEIAALDAEAFRNSGETDAIETAVGLDENGNYIPKTHTNHLDNARSVEEEILALDSAIGGGSSISENIIAGVGLNSDGTYKDKTGTGYLDDASSVEQEIAALDAEAVRSSGETNSIETAVGLDANGNYIQKEDTHYLDEAESIEGEIAALDAEAFRNSGETDNIETAVGLNADGTYSPTSGENTSSASSVKEAIEMLDAQASSNQNETDVIEENVGLADDGTHIESDGHYTSGASTIAEEIAKLDAEAYRNSGETDNIEAGVGLDADGKYVQKEGTAYLDEATSIEEEIAALDAEASRHSGETDTIESAVGLNPNGTYIAKTGTNHLDNATTIDEEILALDAAIGGGSVVSDNIIEAVGLNADGTYNPTSGENTSSASSVKEAIEMLDTQASSNQNETDTIEANVGLASDGTHIESHGYYTSGASTIAEEIAKLDEEAYRNSGETDTIEAGVGLNENGTYSATDGKYTSGATSVKDATKKLDTQAESLQDELDNTQANVGLDNDGDYVAYENGVYTSGATTVLEATSMLDDALKDVQEQITGNKVFGDKAIKVETEETGTTVSLQIKEDNILTNTDDGLFATLEIKKLTAAEIADLQDGGNVREAYKLVGVDGVTAFGDVVKVYKDQTIYSVGLGDMGDYFNEPYQGDNHRTLNPSTFMPGTTGEEALRLIYQVADGSYWMVLISLESFLQESEFKDGLTVNANHEVSVKIDATPGSDSEKFLYMREVPGETKSLALSGITEAIAVETARATGQEDVIEANVGLASDGTHITTTGNYTSSATTIAGEIAALDRQAKSNQDETDVIEANVGLDENGRHIRTTGYYTVPATTIAGEIALLDEEAHRHSGETNNIETSVGLNDDGTYTKTEGRYTRTGASIKAAIELLDAQAESNQDETDTMESALGLNNDGTYKATTTPYSSGETSTLKAIEAVDRQADSLQRELDKVESSAGLAADGSYIDPSTSKYISGTTDIMGAVKKLNDQAVNNQSETDTIESGVGLNPDGTHKETTGKYTSSATTIAGEIAALDAEAYRHSGETDSIETAVGLNADGTHKTTTGKYTSEATTIAGEIAALDAEAFRNSGETDSIETAVGLDENGRYVKTHTKFTSAQTSVYNSIEALDTQAESNQDETNRIETGVGLDADGNYIVTSDAITSGANSIAGAIKALNDHAVGKENELDTVESSVGLAADGTHITTSGHYTSAATTVTGEIAALDAEAFRHSGETDAIEGAVGLNADGTYKQTRTQYTSGETSVYASIEALDRQAVSEQTEIDAVETGVGLAEDGKYRTTTDRFTSGATSIATAIKALNDQASENQDELDRAEAGSGLNADGTHKTTTGHYTSSATTLAGEIAALDSEAYRHSGETDAIETAVGLNDNGTYVKTATRYTSAQTSVYNAVQALDTQAASSQDELDRAESALGLKSDGTYERTNDRFTSGATTMAGAIKGLNDQASANQDETDTIEVGVGLNNDGTYIRKTGTAYLNDATSVEGEIAALDREASRHSGETDSIETAVGLNTDGTYSKPAGVYVSGSTSVKDALEKLNDQAVSNQNETNTVEDGVGLNADGSHIRTNGHYTSTATTIAGEIAALDDEAYRHSGETDSIETAVGLNVDGSYIQPSSSQFISASTNVMSAVRMLNDQAVSNQGETDTIESAVGLNSDGTHITTRGNYTSGASTIAGEIAALDTEAYRNASEHGAIRTAVGLDQNGNYIPTTDRFTSAATSVMGAITLAVRQIDANETNISTFGSDILKNKVHSGSNAITVEETGTEEAGTKVGLWINSSDNVLTQDNGLLATIHLTKATGITTAGTAYNCIRLIGRNNIILDEINTDDFVKDGFLDNVEIVTRSGKNYLVFTWNTDSGKITTEIDATELVKPYTASSGVTLDNNTNNLSGVVDPTSDPYFTVGADGFKLSGVKTAVDTINNLLSGLRSEFDVERLRSQNKDAEQDDRLVNNEHDIQDNTDRIQDLQEQIDQIGILGEGVRDIYTDNGGIEIRNTDVGGEKYRNLKLKLGSTPDDREELPEVNYLRIVTEKDPSTGAYTAFSGLHTTIRPISETEINEIMNLTNIQA